MRLIDLTGDFRDLVRGARTTIEFKARFWGWLDAQRRNGPLSPLLHLLLSFSSEERLAAASTHSSQRSCPA